MKSSRLGLHPDREARDRSQPNPGGDIALRRPIRCMSEADIGLRTAETAAEIETRDQACLSSTVTSSELSVRPARQPGPASPEEPGVDRPAFGAGREYRTCRLDRSCQSDPEGGWTVWWLGNESRGYKGRVGNF